MSAISTAFRSAVVAAVALSLLSGSFSASAYNQEGGYTPPPLGAYNGTNTTTSSNLNIRTLTTTSTATAISAPAVNPFSPKLSTANVMQLGAIIDKIYAKGVGLTEEKFIAYITKINDGIKALGKKPVYASNEAIQNIVGYISFELTTKIESLKNDTTFMDEFGLLLNDSASGTGSTSTGTTATGTTGTGTTGSGVVDPAITYVMCIGSFGNVNKKMPLIEMPKSMSVRTLSRVAAYQRYLSCSQTTYAEAVEYSKTYGAPPGFTPNSGGDLYRTDGLREWEKKNGMSIEYAFDHTSKALKIAGVRYNDDGSVNTDPEVDAQGCLKWKAWWSETEKKCVEYYVAINRKDSNRITDGHNPGDYILNWWTAGMSKCVASGAWSGDKPISGNIDIPEPVSPQTYTITCTGNVLRDGERVAVTASQSVVLDPRPKITSLNFTKTDYSPLAPHIKPGESATINWTSENADYCRIYNGTEYPFATQYPSSGSLTITPKLSYGYSIACTGKGWKTPVKYFSISVY